MNNGRPPYGDPSQWGQQPPAGQDPAAQYGQYPQQPSYGQQTPVTGYPQQPYGQPQYQPQGYPSQPYQPQSYQAETYQTQGHQAQESYQQQTWQPYGQEYQQAYQQQYPQQGYPQQYPQQAQPQQAYQQPQQGYQQQPYQQSMQQSYPQQGVVYNSQPVYSGYVSKPRDKAPVIDEEIIMKVVLCGVLPILFLLVILFKTPALCWIFLAGVVAAVAAMWLRNQVEGNARLIATLVYGVLGIVALVTAFNGTPAPDPVQQSGNGGTSSSAAQQGSYGAGMTWEATPTPTAAPTPAPDPYAEAGAAAEQLRSFFYFWYVNNDENMLALTAPSWRSQQEKPLEALYQIRANRMPLDDCSIVNISGSEDDDMRTVKVEVSISKNIINREPQLYSFDVIMLKEDGTWYVDPLSLTSNETVQTTKAQTNAMPTQPVLNTGSPTTVLYYNPDGGTYYHFDPNCYRIDAKYLPLKGQFLYSQLNDPPYKDMKTCNGCGAPLRPQ